jgi:hypothetical protein
MTRSRPMRSAAQTVPLVRAAIVGVGGVMVLNWTMAWLSYLPGRPPAQRAEVSR